MFCNNCGKKLPDDAKFCDGCGNKIKNDGAAQQPPPKPEKTVQVASPPPSPPTPPPKPSKSPASNYNRPPAYSDDMTKPMSVGQYLVTFIVMAIPLVNLIMLLVWSFGSGTNVNRRNLCRAMLILMVISIAIAIFASDAISSILNQLLGNYGNMPY